MKSNETLWLDALGHIDEGYLDEYFKRRSKADRRRPPRVVKHPLRRRILLAAAMIACLTMVLAISISANMGQFTKRTDEMLPPATTEDTVPYGKIHFYSVFDENGYRDFSNIQNEEELRKAVELLQGSVKLTITVAANPIGKDPQYQEYRKEYHNIRGTWETLEEMNQWKEEYNSYCWQYHAELVEPYMEMISTSLPCYDVQHIEYTPFITCVIDSRELTVEDLISLISNQEFGSISVSRD